MTLRTTAKAVNLRWNRPRQGHDVALQGMGLVGAVDNRLTQIWCKVDLPKPESTERVGV